MSVQKSGDVPDEDGRREKFVARNWDSFKKNDRDLKKMAPQLKSRYLAYEQPSKDAAEAQANSKKRLTERNKEREKLTCSEEEQTEKDKHEKLIGQLKAAEARNRIRIMRLRYEANRSQEINHLIACQPTARKSVRLQALLPVQHEDKTPGDKLDKLQRTRVEALLDDNRGILTGRT